MSKFQFWLLELLNWVKHRFLEVFFAKIIFLTHFKKNPRWPSFSYTRLKFFCLSHKSVKWSITDIFPYMELREGANKEADWVPRLPKCAGRLLRTFVSSEAPLLHSQPFRSTRGTSAPQKNAYKQKAPMFCVIHENWWFVHKIRYFWSFFDTSRNSKGARGSCLAHKHPRM